MLKRLDGVISELGGPDGLSIYVTGHSLGGALASLAALDIKKAHPTYDGVYIWAATCWKSGLRL